eukprot:TRINITY_DN31715_c0_g1_i1.p1 TRINITY_DN31715_c0_g1~~TRINITY_DN31715_c0_g1_i1.p1  ORF type:complete len:130 (+),score=4.81 TRINITY_DN31715_c0_g1_i1:157-546(+)
MSCVVPVRQHGHPADASKGSPLPSNPLEKDFMGKRYIEQIDSFGIRHLDAALVNGQYRVACALKLLNYFHKDSVLFVHAFWSRPQYSVLLEYYDVIGTSSDLVVLRPKRREKLLDGWEIVYRNYLHDAA